MLDKNKAHTATSSQHTCRSSLLFIYTTEHSEHLNDSSTTVVQAHPDCNGAPPLPPPLSRNQHHIRRRPHTHETHGWIPFASRPLRVASHSGFFPTAVYYTNLNIKIRIIAKKRKRKSVPYNMPSQNVSVINNGCMRRPRLHRRARLWCYRGVCQT